MTSVVKLEPITISKVGGEYRLSGVRVGKVLVLSTLAAVEEQIAGAMGKEEACFEGYGKVVGLDLEYNRSSGVGTKLGTVQLAFKDVTIVIQMALLGGKSNKPDTDQVPATLQNLLGDANYAKVGVGIKDDARLLSVALGTPVNGCIELSVLAWTLAHKSLKRAAATLPGCVSLGDLCEAYTEIRLCKDKGKAIPDWSVEVLDDALVHYAAMDAIGSRAVYSSLMPITSKYDDSEKSTLGRVWTFNVNKDTVLDIDGQTWKVVDPLDPKHVQCVMEELKKVQRLVAIKDKKIRELEESLAKVQISK
ncbi:hypothetical protein PILCRDRAFT_15779 [Piloderma croceum F 1598]|uniref:3'-5' exonuclease domain-containing protein n=1 Tax=Piloderma croceum (strain F 1598) TaxID=765440 RepID=A0A0C3EYI9_PILCF|nr:hypothetical protein PILCRDRAFT_15779 [Piloderma croceum F 1598]